MYCWEKLLKQIGIGIVLFMLCTNLWAVSNIEGIQIYQKNMHLFPEHKQKLAADINRYYNADNIWDALRSEFSLSHYENNPLVQEQIAWFMDHQDFLQHSMTRSGPYLYYIFQQVKKRHLPAELALLPIIESAYNPFAYSSAGAAGIWQMMPGTASGYGIKQNWWYDGRRDVITSTKAALNHLLYLASFFEGNWLYAIAAYDTGEGNVISAIKRNIRDGLDIDYWSLPLAQETREYVPKMLALAAIISHPKRYSIVLPPIQNAPYLAQVDIGEQIDLKQAASLAGLSLSQLKQLNPGYSHLAMGPNGPFKLILPIENVQEFTENLSLSPHLYRSKGIYYRVKNGDTIFSIARQFNVSPNRLRHANPTVSAHLKAGHQLIIPNSSPSSISKTILETTQPQFVASNHPYPTNKKSFTHKMTVALENFKGSYTMQPGDTLYIVRQGDNINKIAARFHLSPKTLVAVNNLHHQPSPGRSIIIPTHLTADSTQRYQLTAGDTIYMVRRGDTLEKVAAKFHTSASAIRLINLLGNQEIVEEGDHLVIPTHV